MQIESMIQIASIDSNYLREAFLFTRVVHAVQPNVTFKDFCKTKNARNVENASKMEF